MSDNSTYTFTVTNGKDGTQGIQGEKGENGHTPVVKVGENGNWFIDGVDSGTKAVGVDGKTPYIGSNGNWRIDGTDTGVQAQGPKGHKGDTGEQGPQGEKGDAGEDGQDGLTPFIGENGNWWIGDKDTGVSASGIELNNYFTVTFVCNGGELPAGYEETIKVKYGNYISDLPIPTRKSDVFLGWYTGNSVNDGKLTTFTPILSNITVYARWDDQSNNIKYQYDANTDGYKVIGFNDTNKQTRCVNIPETFNDGIHGLRPVTTIGQGAFANRTETEEISMGNSVTTIESGSFNGTSLKEIRLSNSISSLPDSLFEGLPLESIDLPDSITTVGRAVFKDCKNLKNVELSDNLTILSSKMFEGCSSLTELELTPSIKKLDALFINNTGIKEFTIPNTVTELSQSFRFNLTIEKVYIPSTITYIPYRCFEGAENLQSVTFEADPILESTIGHACFLDCKNLSDVNLTGNITTIESQAFMNCTALKTIVFPESLKTIEDKAFYNARLTYVIIPKGIVNMGNQAFCYCSELYVYHVPDTWDYDWIMNEYGYMTYSDYPPTNQNQRLWHFVDGVPTRWVYTE